MKRIVFITVLTILSLSGASAQMRTSEGQYFLEASGSICPEGSLTGGASIGGGIYNLSSLWRGYVSMDDYQSPLDGLPDVDSPVFDHAHLLFGVDYMYRIASTFRRTVGIYAGAGLFAGYDFFQCFRPLPDNVVTSTFSDDGMFLYGLRPCLELECFVFRSTAIILSGSIPFSFTTTKTDIPDTYHVRISAGIRHNF